jgi:hypothetical protein
MRAVDGLMFAAILLQGCAAQPPERPPERAVGNLPASLYTRAQLKRWEDSCIRSGHALGSADHEACVNGLAKQRLDAIRGPSPPPRSAPCRPDGFGGVTCT